MYYFNDFKGNALAITDAEVAADWRMGVLRATAKVIQKSALPKDSMGSYGSTIPGSNRAHIMGGGGNKFCPLVEVYDVDEDRDVERDYDTIPGPQQTVIVLSGKATCACGQIVKHPVSMTITPGNLIQSVVTADN